MSIYVIHEHHATNLHWDLRFEMNNVLKSWALPKSPSVLKKKNIKRLAIQVEDHSLNYADFEGEIPEGHYGAGKVKIWDKGTFTLESKKPDKIIFELHGKKLNGKYVLLKTKLGTEKTRGKNWLFFKM